MRPTSNHASALADGRMRDGRDHVNGEPRPLDGAPAHTNALDFLRGLRAHRRQGGLRGGRVRCLLGDGRPTRAGRPAPPSGPRSTPAWCRPLALDGQEVVTAEGLGTPAPDLHPVQQEMAARGGSQCGYCTPGFVCSMAAEFYRTGRAATNGDRGRTTTQGDNGFDLHAISGNLCRCTGYRPIHDAAFALGLPAPADPLADGRRAPRRAGAADPAADGEASPVRPPTSRRR